MSYIASAGQILRINGKSQDFQIRVYTGPKRELVKVVTVQNGLGYDPVIAGTLQSTLSLTTGAHLGDTSAFAPQGNVWINGQLFAYGAKSSTHLVHLTPTGAFVAHAAGSPVVQWYEITDKVTSINVSGQLDEYSGTWSASLSGIKYDSAVIDADLAILIQVNVYPDYPSVRVAQDISSWDGIVVQPTTVGWSGWKDFFLGYVVQGSVSKDVSGNTWSFTAEGTSQYMKRSTSPAKSFGRKNLALNKSTKTSSVLQNLIFERQGTPGGEDEYSGSPDVSGAAAVDGDMGTLWVSEGFPSVDGPGQNEDPGGSPHIDGFSVRSPLPGIGDKYTQWVSFYHPGATENRFRYERGTVYETFPGGESLGEWYQSMGLALYRPGITGNSVPADQSSDWQVIDFARFGATIGPRSRLVLCYSKAYFHQIFGQLPDVTVIEWGLLYPDWEMDINNDALFLLDRGTENGGGRFSWPLGWDGGGDEPTLGSANMADGVFWGDQGRAPVGRDGFPFFPHRGASAANGGKWLRPIHAVPRLQPGQYAQRHISGERHSGFYVTQRAILAQGSARRTEWLTIDLGEFFTKTTKLFKGAEYAVNGDIQVDSTAGFAGSGFVLLDTSLFQYSSKTDTLFRGSTLKGGPGRNHEVGTLVYQTDSSGRLINMPLVSAIQFKRPQGKSTPVDGEVRLSDMPNPTDPMTDPQYAGWDWTKHWQLGVWRFNQIQHDSPVSGAPTYEVVVSPPVRARHVCFFITKQASSPGAGSANLRAKLSEVAVYEPVANAGSEAIPVDAKGHADTGAVLKWYLQTKFGLQNSEVDIDRGVMFASLEIAESDYWSVATQLAERTEHLVMNDRFNKISYKPHPLFGLGTRQLPIFFNWTEDTMESVTLNVLQSNKVGQIVLRGRDSTLQAGYTVNYPDSPQAIGTKRVIDDLMLFGSANLIQKAQKHYKYENRPRSVTWKTFIADEVDLGQRHVITADLDESGEKLTGVNFFVTAVDFSISIGEDGNKSWSTQITAEEYVV